MEVWSAYSHQESSDATHVRVGSSQASERDVSITVNGQFASIGSHDEELVVSDIEGMKCIEMYG